MTQPVTWDQIIDAASDNDATVGVQANKYEGYVVWINALMQGAGGDIVSDTAGRPDATVDIGSEAGTEAAEVISKLAASPAAEPDLSVSNEGTVLGPLGGPRAASWSTGRSSTTTTRTATSSTTSAGRATRRRSRARSPGPRSAASTSASARTHPRRPGARGRPVHHLGGEPGAVRRRDGQHAGPRGGLRRCRAAQAVPGRPAGAVLHSIDTAGPRPPSPYWATIVNATLNKWHPADSVDPTPRRRRRRPSSRTSCRGRRCCDRGGGRTAHDHRDRRRPAAR